MGVVCHWQREGEVLVLSQPSHTPGLLNHHVTYCNKMHATGWLKWIVCFLLERVWMTRVSCMHEIHKTDASSNKMEWNLFYWIGSGWQKWAVCTKSTKLREEEFTKESGISVNFDPLRGNIFFVVYNIPIKYKHAEVSIFFMPLK